MIQRLSEAFKSFWKTEGQEHILTPEDVEQSFTLKYQSLIIGTLSFKDGVWIFAYSEAFNSQEEIKPITEFPRKEKTYRSEHLFPFFLHRIPSLAQPKVQQTIREENISPDEVSLLKRFGERAITNPFRLQPVSV